MRSLDGSGVKKGNSASPVERFWFVPLLILVPVLSWGLEEVFPTVFDNAILRVVTVGLVLAVVAFFLKKALGIDKRP